jgi:hypothetical protein
MRTGTEKLRDKVEEGSPEEAGYAAWKRRKVEIGLEQAADRSSLIAAEQMWRDLGLER